MNTFSTKAVRLFYSLCLSFLCFPSFSLAQSPNLNFNGTNAAVLLDTDAGDGLRTIEMWFRPDVNINPTTSLTNWYTLVARNTPFVPVVQGGAGNPNEFDISFPQLDIFSPDRGKVRFRVSNIKGQHYSVYSDIDTWDAGRWYHVAGVIDPIQGLMIFVDGIRQSQTVNFYRPTEDDINATPIAFGRWGDLAIRHFPGSIDAVRFSTDPLYTADFVPPCPDLEVLPSTHGLWNLNASTGTIVGDQSPNGFNGTIMNATWGVDQICSNILCFDGNDDNVDLGTEAGNELRTIEYWFRLENPINATLGSYRGMIVRNNNFQTNNNMGEFLLAFSPNVNHPNFNTTGRISFSVRDGAAMAHTIYSDNNTWQEEVWHHVAGVIIPGDGMRLYIDGVEQMDTDPHDNPTEIDTMNSTVIGAWGNSGIANRHFEGCIDAVRFSTDARYTANFVPPCPDLDLLPSSRGLWNFNERTVSLIARDESANQFDGDLDLPARINEDVCPPPCNINTGVKQNGLVLTSCHPNATYQWIDCGGINPTPVPGATGQSFTPAVTGGYAVIITDGLCVDTSACIEMSFKTTSAIEPIEESIALYPNPTQGSVSLELGAFYAEVELRVMDITGRVVQTQHVDQRALIQLNIEGAQGIYFIELTLDGQKVQPIKVLKN